VVKGMTDVQEEACWKVVHDRMMNYDALAVLLFTATATNLLLPRCSQDIRASAAGSIFCEIVPSGLVTGSMCETAIRMAAYWCSHVTAVGRLPK